MNLPDPRLDLQKQLQKKRNLKSINTFLTFFVTIQHFLILAKFHPEIV